MAAYLLLRFRRFFHSLLAPLPALCLYGLLIQREGTLNCTGPLNGTLRALAGLLLGGCLFSWTQAGRKGRGCLRAGIGMGFFAAGMGFCLIPYDGAYSIVFVAIAFCSLFALLGVEGTGRALPARIAEVLGGLSLPLFFSHIVALRIVRYFWTGSPRLVYDRTFWLFALAGALLFQAFHRAVSPLCETLCARVLKAAGKSDRLRKPSPRP